VSAKRDEQSTSTTSCPSGCCTIVYSCGRTRVRASGVRVGILIPATAAVGRRLAWADVVAVGQNVRTVEPGDRVLYDPEDVPRSRCGGSPTSHA